MSATQPPKPAQVPASQMKTRVEVIDGPDSRFRPPFDPFPLIYWFLFILVVPVVAVWMVHKPVPPPPEIRLPILNQDVPAYHVITSNDIYMKLVGTSIVTTDTVREKGDVIGHYTLTPISSGLPISRKQIGPVPNPSLIVNTYAVAISTNSVMILGGNLQAGDIVSLAVVPLSNSTSPPTIVFDKVLVLDVKSAGNQTIIILAIPVDHWLDYLAKTHNATVVFSRQVGQGASDSILRRMGGILQEQQATTDTLSIQPSQASSQLLES